MWVSVCVYAGHFCKPFKCINSFNCYSIPIKYMCKCNSYIQELNLSVTAVKLAIIDVYPTSPVFFILGLWAILILQLYYWHPCTAAGPQLPLLTLLSCVVIHETLKGSLQKEMTTHSCIPAWKIPWKEKPGGPQSMESWRVGHNWVTNPTT